MKFKHHLIMTVLTAVVVSAGTLWLGEGFHVYWLFFVFLALLIVYLVYRGTSNRLVSTLKDLDEAAQDEVLAGMNPEVREEVLREIGR